MNKTVVGIINKVDNRAIFRGNVINKIITPNRIQMETLRLNL